MHPCIHCAIEPVRSIPGFAEPFSSMTHLLGAVVFVALSVPLVRKGRGNRWRVSTLVLFSFAIVFMFSMSGTYHLLAQETTSRAVLRKLDHAGIFFLIAASFTPTHAILFRGWLRWGIITFVWVVAATAIPLTVIYLDQMSHALAIALYLGMGWVGVISGLAVWHRYGLRFMRPLVAGGLAYTIGALLDLVDWPNPIPGVVHAHDLFHLFVIAGVAFHWRFCHHFADGRIPHGPMSFADAMEELHFRPHEESWYDEVDGSDTDGGAVGPST